MAQFTNGFRGREGAIEDYDRLGLVVHEAEVFHRQALPEVFRKPPERFPPRSLYYTLITAAESTVLVAEREAELVGFVTIRVDEAPDDPILTPRRFAMVDLLAVRREQQHRGIGQALMGAAHSWAHKQGVAEVMLNVWEFNQHAIGFYEELGYTTASRLMSRSV